MTSALVPALAPDDAALAAADPALPGLALLLDPEALSEALAERLPEREVGAVAPRFLRYKRSKSCILLFDVEVDGRAVSAYARAEVQSRAGRLAAMAARSGPTPLGERGVVLDGLAVVVNAYPFDRRLPAAARLADGAHAEAILRALLPDGPPGTASLELLRWRPERRMVLRLVAGGEPQAAIKGVVPARHERTMAAIGAFRSHGPLRVPRVLGSSSPHGLFALEWLPGAVLADDLADGVAQPAVFEAVGRALGELQGQGDARLVPLSPADHAAALRSRGDWLERLDPRRTGRARTVARRVAERIERERGDAVALHGDFTVKQILVADGAPAVLDLDGARRGHPGVDLGLFVSDLERRVLAGELAPARAAALRDALLEGHARGTGAAIEEDTLRLHVAAALLERSAGPFRRREPAWRAALEAMLDQADALLDAAS